MTVKPYKLISGVSPRPTTKVSPRSEATIFDGQVAKAKYKIEILFHRDRSSRMDTPTALMLLIWESGKKYHGGGDQKMYWCGYPECGRPFSSDGFGYMHVICPNCDKELFLDPIAKREHIARAKRDGNDTDGLERMPIIVGEKLARLTPPKLAELLEKTWVQLKRDADIYLKYSPYEIRYDPKEEKGGHLGDKLNQVRVQRKPLIYTLRSIIKDLHAGADLRKRFVAMITA